jgi:hypothetical protein
VLVFLLGSTVPVGIWGDTVALRPETTLGSVFVGGWLILQQVGPLLALLAILNDSWLGQRREPGALRDRLGSLRSQASSPP